jgi:MoaA/NifB/PqqE/SkfB family radical SAM enzyme
VVQWIGNRPFPVGVRLASLGEPFTSWEFLDHAAWLTRQPQIEFVELVTNGSLLQQRLPALAERGDMNKLSLWITHHSSQITMERLLANASFAQERYGCFVTVNALLFPDSVQTVQQLREATRRAGIRFNVDVGYAPDDDAGTYHWSEQVVPYSQTAGWREQAEKVGASSELLDANLIALDDVTGRPCSAGHDYFFIAIDGEVYPCSRYYELGEGRLGNVLDPDFQLTLRSDCWAHCKAPFGCSNKEDFLNLSLVDRTRRAKTPSLGWFTA